MALSYSLYNTKLKFKDQAIIFFDKLWSSIGDIYKDNVGSDKVQ